MGNMWEEEHGKEIRWKIDAWDNQHGEIIREELDQAMEQINDDRAKFITKHKLQEIWTHERLESLCQMVDPRDVNIEATILDLKTNLLRTLSILVTIHWKGWDRFRNIFFDTRYATASKRVDRNIKTYRHNQLARKDFLISDRVAREFLCSRDAFFPIRIQEGMNKNYDGNRRLPLIRSRDIGGAELGDGASGSVTKETIAYGQYSRGKTPQPTMRQVARKVFSRTNAAGNFEKEKKILALLQTALSKHDRVVPFLAIISIGNDYNIFSDLAKMNLDSFLNERWSEFAEEVTPQPLFTELTGIADALRTLHQHLYIPRDGHSASDITGRVLLCHMDLKPENILIYEHPDHPLGLWKISDFGISKVKELREEGPTDEQLDSSKDGYLTVPGHANVKQNQKFTAHTQAGRHSSTYTAPEFEYSPKDVGRKSDVWSLGCIIVLVCALAQGVEIYKDIDYKRGKLLGRDVYDDENGDRFYHKLADGEIILNPQVGVWTQTLLQITHYNAWFLTNCHDTIFSALVIDPEKRATADQLHNSLDSIFDEPSTNKAYVNGGTARVNKLLNHGPEVKPNEELTSNELNPVNGSEIQPSYISVIVVPPESLNGFATPDLKGKGRAIEPSAHLAESSSKSLLKPTLNDLYSADVRPGAIGSLEDTEVSDQSNLGSFPAMQSDSGSPQNSQPQSKENLEPGEFVFAGDPCGLIQENCDINAPGARVIGNLNHNPTSRGDSSKRANINETIPGLTKNEISEISSSSLKPPRRSQTDPVHSTRPRRIPHKPSKSGPPATRRMLGPGTSSSTPSRVDSVRSIKTNISSHTGTSSTLSTVDEIRQSIRVPLELGERRKITKSALPSNNNFVVFLSERVLTVCSLYPGAEYQGHECNAPQGCIWVSASVAGIYILARGDHNGDATYKLFIVVMDERGQLSIDDTAEPQKHSYPDGVVSPLGHLLYQGQDSVLLTHHESTTPRTLLVESGCTIKQIWFNASGSWAFAWFLMANGNQRVKAWLVSDPDIYDVFRIPIPANVYDGVPILSIISFPECRSLAIWRKFNDIMLVPEELTPNWTKDVRRLKNLQALAISPTGDAIAYIRTKTKWLVRSTTLYVQLFTFDTDGNVILGEYRKWSLRSSFRKGSSMSISPTEEEEIMHIFIAHCDGAEKVVVDRRIF